MHGIVHGIYGLNNHLTSRAEPKDKGGVNCMHYFSKHDSLCCKQGSL